MGATMHMMMMCFSSTDYPTLLCWKCFHGAFVSAAWMESSQETSSSCVWCSPLQQWAWSSGDSCTGVVLLFFLSSSVVAFVAIHCCCICWVFGSLSRRKKSSWNQTVSFLSCSLCIFWWSFQTFLFSWISEVAQMSERRNSSMQSEQGFSVLFCVCGYVGTDAVCHQILGPGIKHHLHRQTEGPYLQKQHSALLVPRGQTHPPRLCWTNPSTLGRSLCEWRPSAHSNGSRTSCSWHCRWRLGHHGWCWWNSFCSYNQTATVMWWFSTHHASAATQLPLLIWILCWFQ